MNEIEYTYLIFVWILLIMCELHFLLSFCAGRKSSSESLQCVVWSSGHVHCDLLRLECVSVYLKTAALPEPCILKCQKCHFLSFHLCFLFLFFIHPIFSCHNNTQHTCGYESDIPLQASYLMLWCSRSDLWWPETNET